MFFTRVIIISNGRRRCVGDGELEKGQGKELEPTVITRDGCRITG